MLLRNPFVQVLPLEIGEFGGKKPAIALYISPMAPHSARKVVSTPDSMDQ